MKKITMLIPQYVKNFQCIGSECEDTCCVGWKITIDEITYKKYKKIDNYEMRKKLAQCIGRHRTCTNKYEIGKIKLDNGICPFLSENKLCDIYKALGEEYLSNTCATYPRLNCQVDGVMEQGLSLSCPEAARLILLNKESIQFDQEERRFTGRDLGVQCIQTNKKFNTWKSYFWDIRIFTISLLQNRNYKVEERLFILGIVYRSIEEAITEDKIYIIPSILEKYNKNLESEVYRDVLQDIPKVIEMQLKFCKELIDIRNSTIIKNESYIRCLSELLAGLNFKENVSLEECSEIYQEGYEKYYKPFMDEHSYMIENYLVNYIFVEQMPIKQKMPFDSYVKLILHYALIKIHLIGQASYHRELTSENVVHTIQTFARTFEHNRVYFNDILSLMQKNNYMDLAHMAILIKN